MQVRLRGCGCCLRPSTEGGGRGPQQDRIGLSQRACGAGSWCGGGRGGRRLSGCRGRTGLGGLPSSGVSAAPSAGLAGLTAAAGCLPAFLPVEGRPMLLQCSWRGRRTGGLFRGVDRRSPGATGCLAPVSVLTQAFARPRLQRGKTKAKATYRALDTNVRRDVILADEILSGPVALFTVDQAREDEGTLDPSYLLMLSFLWRGVILADVIIFFGGRVIHCTFSLL